MKALHRIMQATGLGLIFAAFSELWFYRVDLNAGLLFLVFAYSAMAWPMLVWISYFQVKSFARFFLCAALYGYLIEGVVVPTIYVAFPFQMVWTALAWHALLTIGVGYYLLRRMLAFGDAVSVVALTAAMGAFLGIWGAYLWNVIEDDGPVRFAWQPVADFALQTCVAYAFFLGGNLLLDRSPQVDRASRFEMYLATALVLVLWGLGSLPLAFPLSLVLPVVLIVLALALARAPEAGVWTHHRIRIKRYLLTLPLPVVAIGTYALFARWQFEFETNVPVAIVTSAVALFLMGRSLWRASMRQ